MIVFEENVNDKLLKSPLYISLNDFEAATQINKAAIKLKRWKAKGVWLMVSWSLSR